MISRVSILEKTKVLSLNKDEAKDRISIALDAFPELEKFKKRKAGTLSGGERQFLAIATALVRKAEVLMLDEPTAQLSPKLAELMFNRIVDLRDRYNLTVVLVEQNVQRALEISDKAYLLVSGRVAFEGRADELLEHEKFEKLCMGIID